MSNVSKQNLVNPDALRSWMDGAGLGTGAIENAHFLSGGTQNILLSFERSGRRYVLRRPPAHPTANGDTIMQREMQVLQALVDTDVPHPLFIAGCCDKDVLGAAFYLTEAVEGFNATVALPVFHAKDPEIRRRMGFALMDGALALSRVDYKRIGLDNLGKPDAFLDRQVPRWLAQLDGYVRYDGWLGPSVLPGVDQIAKWLDDNRPATFSPGIMHGDYHLFNVMFRNDGPELAAIMDWELATVGDPLLDLGVVLAGWPEGEDQPAGRMVTPWDGFPSAAELIEYMVNGVTGTCLSSFGIVCWRVSRLPYCWKARTRGRVEAWRTASSETGCIRAPASCCAGRRDTSAGTDHPEEVLAAVGENAKRSPPE